MELLSEQRPDDELTFLMGADVAAAARASGASPSGCSSWRGSGSPARPGTELDEAEAALERLGAASARSWIRMPEIGVSSTRIRARIAAGRPIRYLVPEPVAELIAERGLYREAVPA